jgi:hypothetical protein
LWYGEGLRNNLRFDVDILCVLSANIISQWDENLCIKQKKYCTDENG